MTFYRLHDSYPGFPDPRDAEPNGLLAMGGDLSPERLLIAYSMGIFPWYNPGDPILWHSPTRAWCCCPRAPHQPLAPAGAPRCRWDVRYDRLRPGDPGAQPTRQEGTWITPEMIKAYERLHELGFATALRSGTTIDSSAACTALRWGAPFLVSRCLRSRTPRRWRWFIWCAALMRRVMACSTVSSSRAHRAFGAFPMERDEFLDALTEALCHETERGSWAGSWVTAGSGVGVCALLNESTGSPSLR